MSILDDIAAYLEAPVNPEKEAQYLSAINQNRQTGEREVKNALRQSEQMDKFASELGMSVMPEPKPSLLFRTLDTLDTPRQAVAGVISSALNRDGYSDLDFLEAARKGMSENLTTGEMLRDFDVTKNLPFSPETNQFLGDYVAPVVRGAAGFVGDVVTDPTTYIAPFGGLGKKLGGLPVSEEAIKTVAGAENATEIYQRLLSQEKTKALAQGSKLLNVPVEKLDPALVGIYEAGAARSAEAPFRDLGALRDTVKKYGRLGDVGKEAASGLDAEVYTKAQKIASSLGVDLGTGPQTFENIYSTLDSLVKRPAIRLNSPFSGAETVAKLPGLAAPEADIPGITKLSEKLYSGVVDGYYGTVRKVMDTIDTARTNDPENLMWKAIDTVGDKLLNARKGVSKIFFPVSKRIQASGDILGSQRYAEGISDLKRAQGMVNYKARKEAESVLGPLLDREGAAEMFTKMSRTLQAYPDLQLGGAQRIAQEFGPEAGSAIENVRALFDELAKREVDANILGKTIDGYVYQIYNPAAGLNDPDSPAWEALRNAFGSGAAGQDFSMQRTFKNMAEARGAGYNPEENLLNILHARLYAHHQAMAEKEFAERFMYQVGMTPPAYNKLIAASMSESAQIRKRALNALSTLELTTDPAVAFKTAFGDAKMMTGTHGDYPMTLGQYDEIAHTINNFQSNPLLKNQDLTEVMRYKEALKSKERFGLNFSPEERARIQVTEKVWNESLSMIPGTFGESALARGGARQLSDGVRSQLKGLTPDEKVFWEGALPKGFVDAFEETLNGRNLMQQIAKAIRKNPNDKIDIKNPILRAVNLGQKINRFMKETATIYWPAYTARNVGSAPFQALRSTSILGDALNIPKVYRNHKMLTDPAAKFVSATGEVISQKQMFAEMLGAGMQPSNTMAGEFLNSYVDELERVSTAVQHNIPEMREVAQKQMREVEANILKRGRQKLIDFNQTMEAFGRQNAYIDLRLKGYGPASATETVNKLMIDYANGKTQFERNILNNVFFFYSFARGNASNMFMQMVMKPGALTSQLHAFDGIAEMLTDPNNFEPKTDFDQLMTTARMENEMAKYVGTNPKTGLPRVMRGVGTPVEDFGKYLGIVDSFTKPTKMTWGEAMLAAGDSASNALKTAFTQLNPMAQSVMKLITQRDFYFDRPITDETLRKIPSWERDLPRVFHVVTPDWVVEGDFWKKLDDATQAALDGHKNADGTITINPYAMAFMSSVAGISRFFNTRDFLTKPGVATGEKVARLFSGVRIQEVDPEKTLAYDAKGRREEYYAARGTPITKKRFEERRKLMESEE